jgi:hypothetical protein
LLKADVSEASEGWSDSRIVEAVETNVSMVYRVRKQWVEEGLEAVLSRKASARPSAPRIFDGEKEARLIALACSRPPEGHARWSSRLLGEQGGGARHRRGRQRLDDPARAQKKRSSTPPFANTGSFRPRPAARS